MNLHTFVVTALPLIFLGIVFLIVRKRKKSSGPLLVVFFLAFLTGAMLADTAFVAAFHHAVVTAIVGTLNQLASLL